MSSQNSSVEALTPNVIAFGGGTWGGAVIRFRLGNESETLMMGLMPL